MNEDIFYTITLRGHEVRLIAQLSDEATGTEVLEMFCYLMMGMGFHPRTVQNACENVIRSLKEGGEELGEERIHIKTYP